MRADPRFTHQPKSFWANVRTISQQNGYTRRGTGSVRVHGLREMMEAMAGVGLGTEHLFSAGEATHLAQQLEAYFSYRAEVLNNYVEPRLMDVERAREVFRELFERLRPRCPIPSNKQKGESRDQRTLLALSICLLNSIPPGYL